ncbi:MAG: hypothetical protein K5696_01300 [Lachnospiraceae bacterium]|nr:hypothetical protein [Lachnospiraceae bacterium]
MRKKLYFAFIVVAELIFSAIWLFGLRDRQILHFGQEELLVASQRLGQKAGEETPAAGFYLDHETGAAVVTPEFHAKRGIYVITTEFQTNAGPDEKNCISRMAAADDTRETEGARLVDSERGVLYENAGSVTYRADVRESADFHVTHYLDPVSDGQYLIVNGVTVTRMTGKTLLRDAFMLFVLFFLSDLLLAGMLFCKERVSAWLSVNGLTVGFLAGITAFACFPLCARGILFGDDIFYHLRRIAFLAEGLGSGSFPVKIQPGWSNGFGYAAGVGYGDILLVPPALLYLLGFPLSFAYKSYIVLVTALTVWISFVSFRRIGGGRFAGMAGCALYTLAGFRLHSIYAGATIGEYGAYTFLPLVLLGLWEIYTGADGAFAGSDADKRAGARGENLLAAGIGLVVGTHVLTTYLLAVCIVLFVLFMARYTFKKPVFAALLRALGKTVLLSLWFVVPLAHYLLTDSFVGDPGKKILWNHAIEPKELFVTIPDPSGVSGGFLGVGIAAFVILGVFLSLLLAGRFAAGLSADAAWRVFGFALLFLWMSTTWFPWHFLDKRLPVLYGFLSRIQFPWHFLDFAILMLCLMAVMAIRQCAVYEQQEQNRKILYSQLLAALLITLTMVQGGAYLGQVVREGRSIWQMGDENLRVPINVEFSVKGSTPATAWFVEVEPEGERAQAQILWQRGTGMAAAVVNPSPEPVGFLFPRWAYRGYTAGGTDGRLKVTEATDHRVRVTVPAGYDGVVVLRFREPWFWRLSELVSLVAWLWILILKGLKPAWRWQSKQ